MKRMFPDPSDGERVIAVTDSTVVTRRGSLTTTYLGVTGRVSIGDVLLAPPRHSSRRVHQEWSPFDEPGADDDEGTSTRRMF